MKNNEIRKSNKIENSEIITLTAHTKANQLNEALKIIKMKNEK